MNFKNIFIRSLDGESKKPKVEPKLDQPYKPGIDTFTYNYMSIPTVNRCVKLLANRFISIGLQHQTLVSGSWTNSDYNLNRLLSVEPNMRSSAPTMYTSLIADILLNGESYIVPKRIGNTISELVFVESKHVTYSDSDSIYHVNDTAISGIVGDFDEHEILHFVNFSYDGRRGKGFKHFAQQTANLAAATDSKLLQSFNQPDVFIKSKVETPGRANLNDAKDVADKLQADFSTSASVINQPQYTSFELVPIPNQKTGVVETKVVGIHDICRFFGVPAQFVFENASSNYKDSFSSIYQMHEAVIPLIQIIESEFNRKLIPFEQSQNRRFICDLRKAYLTAEPSYIADYYLKALQAGMVTVNEVRSEQGKSGVEGGDHVLISANLTCVDALLAKTHKDAGIDLSNDTNCL